MRYPQTKRAELLTIGNELLKGSTLNTNARFLGRELTDLGFQVAAQVACPDCEDVIGAKLGESLSRADVIIVTGGLGPTPDDVTREGIADFFGVPLIFSQSQFALIKKLYQRKGRKVPEIVRKEAHFPENSAPLINRHGIALGFSIAHEGRLVIVLPGVPGELERMYRELVRPLLLKNFPHLKKKPALVARMVGVSEPDVMRCLGEDFFDDPFDFGIYPEVGEVTIRIQAEEPAIIRRLLGKIRKRLGESVYAYEEILLAQAIGKILMRRKKTLAVAESCTGGLLAAEITKISGASRYFKGGITAYHNAIKKEWLGVSGDVLAKKGAVSPEVALQLACGVREKMNTSFGIGITGIAGPEGGTAGKPVGRVYLSIVSEHGKKVWKENFWGDRGQVQAKAVKKALEFLWRQIR